MKTQLHGIDTEETQLDEVLNVTKVHIVSTIYHYLKDRYIDNSINYFLKKCTILDPRFKHFLTNNDLAVLKDQLVMELNEIQPNKDIESKKPKKAATGFGAIFASTSMTSSVTTSEDEFQKYISFPGIDFTEDPLKWWAVNALLFPSLSVLAKKYLTCQATSVPSERVFSKGGHVCDNKTCLTGEHAEQLIFLAANKTFVKKF